MSESTTLYLVRHGATAQNERRPVVLQGSGIDGPLSETGRQQAAAVERVLRRFPLVAVYSSPLRRAQETARMIAEHHSLNVQTVETLHEVGVGEWEGQSWKDVMKRYPEHYDRFMQDSANVPYLGGESYGDVLRRAKPALLQLMRSHVGRSIVVVAHNVVNRVLLADLLGLDLNRAKDLRQSNCCINVLQAKEGVCEVVTLNAELDLLRH